MATWATWSEDQIINVCAQRKQLMSFKVFNRDVQHIEDW